ncbi:MAG: hypothetical protein B7Y80_02295 [Hyphomicrobium sp. 32-62-53]|nr:MAG: hypothetical protein B7Z29_02645 [Hyphomicrobium sp. 12-62-95]OYY01573.1 MAG: hypothetical protein B7Y80_02295 [Hyphomicrobium sp. 32-62-53]
MSPAQRRRAAHQYRRSTSMFATTVMSAGIIIALTGALGAWRGILTQSWPTVEGTLITNVLETATDTRAIPMTDRLRGGIKETAESEQLALAYRYTVDGVPFEGHKLEPWDFGLPGQAKMKAVAALGAGAKHPVSYDPQDPRRAYLKAGPSTTSLSLLTIGGVLMAVGFFIGRMQRRA